MEQITRGGLLESLKKPWLMSDGEKCGLASLLVLFQSTPFLGFALLFRSRPDLVPYMDQGALGQTLVILYCICGAFLLMLPLSAAARSRPALAKVLPYVFCQLFAIGFAGIAYEVGPYTSDIMGGVLLTGAIVGLLLFDRFAVLLGMLSALLMIFVSTLLTQVGVMQYAPLLSASPVTEHHLPNLWVASLGGVMLIIEIIACAILYYFLYRLRDREADLSRVRSLISRYVPAQVVSIIVDGRDAAIHQHERRKLTLFFSDLVGFTEIAERSELEDLSRILNEYFTAMTSIAERYDGTVDELSGDAILIFFGAPHATNDADHALRAVRMATDMQEAMVHLNNKWRAEGIEETLRVRMGIDTGVVAVGNFGSQGRMKYAVLGKHVNIAARLQASCPPGHLVISHATWLLVRDQISCTPNGEIALKGLHRPVKSYEVGIVERPALPSRVPSSPLVIETSPQPVVATAILAQSN